MINYLQLNILDMLEFIGEDSCQNILSSFICPLNLIPMLKISYTQKQSPSPDNISLSPISFLPNKTIKNISLVIIPSPISSSVSTVPL